VQGGEADYCAPKVPQRNISEPIYSFCRAEALVHLSRRNRLHHRCAAPPDHIDSSPHIRFDIFGERRRKQLRCRGTTVDLRVPFLCPALQRSNCDLRFFYARLNMKRRQERFL
jgi:hypothetical protein